MNDPLEKPNPARVEYFKDIVGTIREPLLVLDKDLRVLAANRSFYRFFKVKAGETIGQLIYDLGERQWDIPSLRLLLENLLPRKASFHDYHVEHDFPFIGRRILLLNAHRIPAPPKKAQWILLAFEDVTGRKQLEEILRESEKKYRELFMEMENGAASHEIICDDAGNPIDYITLDVNKAYEAFLNVKREAVVGKKASSILPPEELQKWVGIFGPVALTGISAHYEMYSQLNNRYFEGSVYCMTKGKFAVTFTDVTERKLAEGLLHTSDQQLRLITDNMHDMVIRTDLQGLVLYASPSHLSVLGIRPEDMQGKSMYTFMHPDDVERVQTYARASLQKGTPGTQEFRYRHVDGHYLWIESTGVIFFDENGTPAGVVFSSHDITGRKQAEEALSESEEKFRLAFMTGLDAFYWATLEDGRILEVNPVFEAVFGYPREEVIGKSSLELGLYVNPPDRARMVAELKTNGVVKDLELKARKKGGEIITISLSVSTSTINNQKYILGSIRDISGRKRAEEALIYERTLLSALMDNIPDHIYFKDIDSRFIRINRAQADIFGMSDPVQAIGKMDFDFFTENHARPAYENEQEIIQTGRPMVNFEETETYRDGRVATISTTKIPFCDPNGQIIGTIGISRDITGRKLAEEALRESEERYRLVQENSMDAILLTAPDGSILSTNQAACEMFQMTEEEICRSGRNGLVDIKRPTPAKSA